MPDHAMQRRRRGEKAGMLSWPWAGWRMPNALILEYQKSVIWHAPSRLHKRSRATGIDLDCFDETTGRTPQLMLPGWAFVD